MPRTKRKWISGRLGSIHIISRTARNDIMFSDEEKEYFMELIQRFASGFYVDIHAFCVMGTHFHILASSKELEAKKAENEELYRRYRFIYGEDAEPPAGSYDSDGTIILDGDGGIGLFLAWPLFNNWLAVGDAAFAYDPVSSYGIASALGGDFYAGNAIADHLNRKPEALPAYHMVCEKAYRLYREMLSVQYRLEQRWPGSIFWKRRHLRE